MMNVKKSIIHHQKSRSFGGGIGGAGAFFCRTVTRFAGCRRLRIGIGSRSFRHGLFGRNV